MKFWLVILARHRKSLRSLLYSLKNTNAHSTSITLTYSLHVQYLCKSLIQLGDFVIDKKKNTFQLVPFSLTIHTQTTSNTVIYANTALLCTLFGLHSPLSISTYHCTANLKFTSNTNSILTFLQKLRDRIAVSAFHLFRLSITIHLCLQMAQHLRTA